MARARYRRPILGIEYEGPFFEYDPRKRFRANITVFMDRIAELTEAEVKRRIAGGGRSGAHTAPHVVGRTSSLTGKHWAVTARVSVSTIDLATGKRNPLAMRRMAIAAGRHVTTTAAGRYIGRTRGAEGQTHAFRDAKKAIQDAAQANVDKLLEGIR